MFIHKTYLTLIMLASCKWLSFSLESCVNEDVCKSEIIGQVNYIFQQIKSFKTQTPESLFERLSARCVQHRFGSFDKGI